MEPQKKWKGKKKLGRLSSQFLILFLIVIIYKLHVKSKFFLYRNLATEFYVLMFNLLALSVTKVELFSSVEFSILLRRCILKKR